MALTKITKSGIADSSVDSSKIEDGSIVNADVSPSAAIASGKLTVDTSVIEADVQKNAFNISLLGFKMAVNDGLTVFNLVDGVVDEFQDESGTDEAEGSNDTYCGTNDLYQNSTPGTPYSAGFGITSITEPDTSTAQANPAEGTGTFGTYTVPTDTTSLNFKVWGSAGGGGTSDQGGGGGFVSGDLSVTSEQVVHVGVGEGGVNYQPGSYAGVTAGGFLGGGSRANDNGIAGGGMSILANNTAPNFTAPQPAPATTPGIYAIGGAGGGGAEEGGRGGAGGGLIGGTYGQSGDSGQVSAQTPGHGGGGSQTQGGQGGTNPGGSYDVGGNGSFLLGASPSATGNGMGRGGGGFYGGGGGSDGPGSSGRSGGGGSSYYGNPNVSSGSTEGGSADNGEAGGASEPNWPGTAGEGFANNKGEDGYVLLTATSSPVTSSTTIVSNAFTSSSAVTTSRIVVFEEDIDSPTLNTDIIASISRDGGTTFTNATLSDSGYVTGSSGQRILTGQATVSGQPTGQSMRWKLALANNAVKIHGVSLQWS